MAVADSEGERYRKLVVTEGRITGAALLAHPEHAAAVLAASREERVEVPLTATGSAR